MGKQCSNPCFSIPAALRLRLPGKFNKCRKQHAGVVSQPHPSVCVSWICWGVLSAPLHKCSNSPELSLTCFCEQGAPYCAKPPHISQIMWSRFFSEVSVELDEWWFRAEQEARLEKHAKYFSCLAELSNTGTGEDELAQSLLILTLSQALLSLF